MKVLTIDIETTGVPTPRDADYKTQYMDFPYIVSLAYKINGDETQSFIINQEGRPIPPETIAIHGITDEMASASPYFLGPTLEQMISVAMGNDFTVGHNVYFDSSIIKANTLRMISEGKAVQAFYDSIEVLLHKDRRIDTMKSTIKFCALPGPRGAKWPKLTELYMKLFNEPFNAHNAKDDVDATHKCFLKLVDLGVIKLHDGLGNSSHSAK